VLTIGQIHASATEIASIIGVIDGIAFQTNILALNAAVEAARAGEQGRGFAVVAAEVRSLAGRSAEAARQIKVLIATSVERVEQGTQLVGQAGRSMEDIVAGVASVTQMIGGIAEDADRQARRVGEVVASVAMVDEMTQQNAALVEQSVAASHAVRDQAETMRGLVRSFSL
jgi:methyl-accepting chemotaxis protein